MSYAIRAHPLVRKDLRAIAELIADYAGPEVARRKIAEIEAAVRALAVTPHKGTIRDEIAPGVRAIPAGRRGVVVFTVDDRSQIVLIYAITYGGGDWMARVRRRNT